MYPRMIACRDKQGEYQENFWKSDQRVAVNLKKNCQKLRAQPFKIDCSKNVLKLYTQSSLNMQHTCRLKI